MQKLQAVIWCSLRTNKKRGGNIFIQLELKSNAQSRAFKISGLVLRLFLFGGGGFRTCFLLNQMKKMTDYRALIASLNYFQAEALSPESTLLG